jgi:hypothetical protein
MKFLSRFIMVLALLSGLAYGSYAIGKYILSNRLFGSSMSRSKNGVGSAVSQSRVAPSVTRRTTIKGDKPRVEMEVLPAQEAGPGPEPPPISALERITAGKNYTVNTSSGTASGGSSRTSGPALGTRSFDNPSAVSRNREERAGSSSDDSDDSEERPRRRRRRRRSYSDDESNNTSSARRYRRRSTRRERDSSSYQSRAARSESSTAARRSTTGQSAGGTTESPVPVPE